MHQITLHTAAMTPSGWFMKGVLVMEGHRNVEAVAVLLGPRTKYSETMRIPPIFDLNVYHELRRRFSTES